MRFTFTASLVRTALRYGFYAIFASGQVPAQKRRKFKLDAWTKLVV
jgi:hypothetical protein